jgi:tetratricopeptide (TPR) repeat protein
LDVRKNGWSGELLVFSKLIHISHPSVASAAVPVSTPVVQAPKPNTQPIQDASMRALMANAPATRQSPAPKIWAATAPQTQPDIHGTVAITGPIRSKADTLWRQVKDLDRGQGIGSQIDNAAAMRLSANALFDHQIFDAAGDSYQQLIKICTNIQAADANRKLAARARDKAKAAEVSAEAQGAPDDAADLWLKSQSLDAQAKSLFDDGDFSAARAGWDQAAKTGEDAGVRATGVFQVREAKQQYETAIAGHDMDRLEQYGGAQWTAVKDAAARGAAGAQDNEYAGAATAYGDALRLLPAAVATADDQWHKAEVRRIQPLVDQHVAAAKDLIRRQISIAAMDEIQKAMAIYANDETAKHLRASLLRTDVDGVLALSTILPPQNFAGIPFQQCVQKLQDASGIQIVIDAKGFDEAGASKTAPITASFGRSRLEGVLDQLCGQLGGHMPIGYSVSNGVITLTRADALAQRTQTIVYHVNDLCRNAADFQDLADRVAAEVDPVSWKSNGGTIGHTSIGPGSLVITQTQENQRLIDKFFQKLRMK